MRLQRVKRIYCIKWYVPASLWMVFFLCWFIENYFAFGPGWDNWWFLAWLVNAIVFFIMIFRRKEWVRVAFLVAFVLCNVIQFGGCRIYNHYVPPLLEEKEYHLAEYDRLRLGRYSHCIPVGARNITFSYYDGLFSGYHVTCDVSEKDFLWFCWRNGYRLRKGALPINERTGKAMEIVWFTYDPNRIQDYYSYFDVAESCAGRKILYDTMTQKLNYDWSTN